MTISIRRATPADATAIQAVARESWHAAYGEFLELRTIDSVIDEWYAVDALRGVIDADEHYVFVATQTDRNHSESDDKSAVSGFVHVGPDPDTEEQNVATLARIYVHSAEWGEGIGRTLLERAETALVDDNYERLTLGVFAENDVGVEFYESTGFDRVEAQTDTFGGNEHPVFVFEKPL